MKTRPILFNGEMVRAILAGRKTQTRRVVKTKNEKPFQFLGVNAIRTFAYFGDDASSCVLDDAVGFPYGQPGDRLWVRETWRALSSRFDYRADYPQTWERGEHDVETDDPSGRLILRAEDYKWRPSIHMPREASRITLEVKAVRVERVQEIHSHDALAEGIFYKTGSYELEWFTPNQRDAQRVEDFKKLWNSINEKRGSGWEKNPWVWVIEFERVTA